MPALNDIVGIIGVALIIVAYLLLQMEKLRLSDPIYTIMNLLGALMIIYSLIYDWNLSAFVIELFWVLISLYGLVRHFQSRPGGPA